MEQAERVSTSDGAARSQHVVYVLPHTSEALAQVLAPSLERIDPGVSETQLLIVTPEAETAVIVSDLVHRLVGPQGVEVIAVTAANRAARLMNARPVHAVAGPAPELHTLVQRSTLKLGDVRTVLLTGMDDVLRRGNDAVAALEALFAEIPKEADRIFVTRQLDERAEHLIERYARNARRILPPAEPSSTTSAAGMEQLTVQYVTVTPASRLVTLRRLLDDLDPPSAAVLVRSAVSEDEVRQALRQLGYRRRDDPVHVTREPVEPGTHTVILFDAPESHQDLARLGGIGAVQTITLVTPQQLEILRGLGVAVVPFTLRAAGVAARQHDRLLREELVGVLGEGTRRGVTLREILALEPLLDRYDALEIAAAAVRLLERERERGQSTQPTLPVGGAAASTRGNRAGEDRVPEQRPEQGAEARPGRHGRDFAGRPKRDSYNDRKRSFGAVSRGAPTDRRDDRRSRDVSDHRRDPGDRSGKDFGGRSKRDYDDRRKRHFKRGPRER